MSGNIPPELGSLIELVTLNIMKLPKVNIEGDRPQPPRNDPSGPIPSELGKLTQLAVLSLANNQLSGAIPHELGNLEIESALPTSNPSSVSSPKEANGVSQSLLTVPLERVYSRQQDQAAIRLLLPPIEQSSLVSLVIQSAAGSRISSSHTFYAFIMAAADADADEETQVRIWYAKAGSNGVSPALNHARMPRKH
jgi:hypothetical protein